MTNICQDNYEQTIADGKNNLVPDNSKLLNDLVYLTSKIVDAVNINTVNRQSNKHLLGRIKETVNGIKINNSLV